MAVARRRRERERGPRGFDSPSYLGLGWSVEGGPRGPAAVVLGGSGGGAREPERSGVACGGGERREGPFYRRSRSVEGRARRWRPVSGTESL